MSQLAGRHDTNRLPVALQNVRHLRRPTKLLEADACRNPAVDPRDQTRLVLVRAANGRVDYAVAAGRYGVGAGDLLRLTCATGAVVGIVPR